VEYMGHLQDYGDTDWFEQPYSCGTAGQGRRLEGFAIRPRRSSAGLGLRYMAHIQLSMPLRLKMRHPAG
jgi:hypothetical protein